MTFFNFRKQKDTDQLQENYYMAGQWRLMFRKFRKHKLAGGAMLVLILLYLMAFLADFINPYPHQQRFEEYLYSPPTRIHIFSDEGIHLPFVYRSSFVEDPETWEKVYGEDKSQRYPLRLFVKGWEYRLFGFIPTDRHLFGSGIDGVNVFLFGTDKLGRDLFSRTLVGSRVSLTIGFVGIFISFVLGCALGGISGFYGGIPDTIIQRIIEFLLSIPTIPLWLTLSASLPPTWGPLQTYFGITVILSIVGWTGLARVVRGKMLELRQSDFITSAIISGGSDRYLIGRHMLPSFSSYLIVNITLAIPGMILGETALSFLGLGIRPPAVSWGAMMSGAQNIVTLSTAPWLLIPGLMVIITVLAFNFLGDGLRDAADPYK